MCRSETDCFLSSAAKHWPLSKRVQRDLLWRITVNDAAGSAYPDCSDAFNNAMKDAIYLGSGKTGDY